MFERTICWLFSIFSHLRCQKLVCDILPKSKVTFPQCLFCLTPRENAKRFHLKWFEADKKKTRHPSETWCWSLNEKDAGTEWAPSSRQSVVAKASRAAAPTGERRRDISLCTQNVPPPESPGFYCWVTCFQTLVWLAFWWMKDVTIRFSIPDQFIRSHLNSSLNLFIGVFWARKKGEGPTWTTFELHWTWSQNMWLADIVLIINTNIMLQTMLGTNPSNWSKPTTRLPVCDSQLQAHWFLLK